MKKFLFDLLLKIIIQLLIRCVNSYFKVFRHFRLVEHIESAYNMIVSTKTKCEKTLNFFRYKRCHTNSLSVFLQIERSLIKKNKSTERSLR